MLSEKVDVVFLTKNSMKPCLKECLDAVYANVPVGRLLVIDGGSTDGTLDVVKTYANCVVIDDVGGNRATARQKGIEAAKQLGTCTLTPTLSYVKTGSSRPSSTSRRRSAVCGA